MGDSMLTVLRPRPVDDPAVRLYLLHHAGGSHTTFRTWIRMFPADWEIRLVVAPGRAKGSGHPVARELAPLAHALADHLGTLADDETCALFGHSMGGLVSFAAALELQERGRRAPHWVGVSGHPGPLTAITRTRPPLHRLPSGELRTALGELGGLPDRVLRDPLLWDHVQPLVRADLEAAETYRPARPEAVLDGALSAFCGDTDPVAVAGDAATWARHATDFRGVREYPGGHFYFLDSPAALVDGIVTEIRGVLSARTGKVRAA